MVCVSRCLVITLILIDRRGLAKTDKITFNELISDIKASEDKMLILGLLSEQMDLLITNGKTSPDTYGKHLQSLGWISHLPSFTTKKLIKDVESLRDEMTASSAGGQIRTLDDSFTFDIDSLSRLQPMEWFNAQLIMLCLHLAHKHSYVRVGHSVDLHWDRKPAIVRSNPFQMAARKIAEWNTAEDQTPLVSFFPLFLQGDHFGLLEINERDRSIYYYDSLERGDEANVKV